MLSTLYDRASSYTKMIDSKTRVLQTERLKTEPPQSGKFIKVMRLSVLSAIWAMQCW